VSVSVKWHIAVNFLESQKQAGNYFLKNDYEKGLHQVGEETGSRKA